MTRASLMCSFELGTFDCERCGACCRSVALSPLTAWLDSGDGVCRHLDRDSQLCRIYESRPDICRVDVQYVRFYAQQFSWHAFCELNQQCCGQLKTNVQATQEAIFRGLG